MKPQPWFKFWAADFLADEDIACLPLEACGALAKLWAFCWREGTIPADPATLCTMIGLGSEPDENRIRLVSGLIAKFFKPHPQIPGRLISPRMEKERADIEERQNRASEAARIANDARWHKGKRDPIRTGSASDKKRSPSGSQSVSESESDRELHPTGAAAGPQRAPKAKPKVAPEGRWQDVLGTPQTLGLFYELVRTWKRNRVPNMTQAAQGFKAALDEGITGETLVSAGKAYVRESTDQNTGETFLMNLHAWLQHRGYAAYTLATPDTRPEPLDPELLRQWARDAELDEDFMSSSRHEAEMEP